MTCDSVSRMILVVFCGPGLLEGPANIELRIGSVYIGEIIYLNAGKLMICNSLGRGFLGVQHTLNFVLDQCGGEKYLF